MNWNDLTMAQKNELMQTYIRNGVTSLEDMRSHFNSFDKGGFKDTVRKIAHRVNEHGNKPIDDVLDYDTYVARAIGSTLDRHEINNQAGQFYEHEMGEKWPLFGTQEQINAKKAALEKARSNYKQQKYQKYLQETLQGDRITHNQIAAGAAVAGSGIQLIKHPIAQVIGTAMTLPDQIYDLAAAIDESKNSNTAHVVTDYLPYIGKLIPGKLDDVIFNTLNVGANVDDAVSTQGRDMFEFLNNSSKEKNSFADGGPKKSYKEWAGQMQKKYPWLEMDSKKAGYDYERYFNENYEDAIARLAEAEARHFTDRYKLANHPTYSNESVYSQGPSIGGEWTEDDKFIPSVINRQQYPKVYDQDRAYTEKEIYDKLHKFDEGGPTGAVKKAMYDRMPVAGTYMLPEVDITPESERPNWFARQSMNAAMAENAPYMQAVGWQQDRNGNYHQDPTTPGAEELRKALFEIGMNGAMDVFGGPLIEKALEYGVKGVQGLKNVYKSQKNLRAIDKGYERALNKIPTNSDGTYTSEAFEQVKKLNEQRYKAIYGDNVDIAGLSYFKNEAPTKVVRKGRTVKTVRGGNKDIIRYEDVESAVNETQRQLQEQPITTSDILKQAKKDFNRIHPGHTAALIDNLSLSKDSYPLLERLAQREAMHNTGKITPVIDDGNYRMIQLNRYGKYQGKKDIDRAIQGLRDVTGDVNIPNRVSLLGTHYVPAFTFTKFGNGGYLFKNGRPLI